MIGRGNAVPDFVRKSLTVWTCGVLFCPLLRDRTL